MKLVVEHYTRYDYTAEVELMPQHLYFFPASRNYYRIKQFDISVAPVSEGIYEGRDTENNVFHQAWFRKPTDFLELNVKFELELMEFNPLAFLREKSVRNPFIENYNADKQCSSEMFEWARQIEREASDPVDFLIRLTDEIYNNWQHHLRYVNNILSPSDCFNDKKGSCRDLSWMMIHMFRCCGYGARFVSGYAFNPELEEGHELHAWVEIWIHGPGWVGADPSAGLIVNHYYVPIVASIHPNNTFPVQGAYAGAADSRLTFKVKLSQYANN